MVSKARRTAYGVPAKSDWRRIAPYARGVGRNHNGGRNVRKEVYKSPYEYQMVRAILREAKKITQAGYGFIRIEMEKKKGGANND